MPVSVGVGVIHAQVPGPGSGTVGRKLEHQVVYMVNAASPELLIQWQEPLC